MTTPVPKRVFPLDSLDSAGGSIYVNLSPCLYNRSLVCDICLMNTPERDLFESSYATRLNRSMGLYFGL